MRHEVRRLRLFKPRGSDELVKFDKELEPRIFLDHITEANATLVPEEERFNLFVTLGTVDEKNKGRTWLSQNVLMFDIDDTEYIDGVCNHKPYLEALKDTLSFDFDKALWLSSGHGLQIIVELKERITTKAYFELHKKFFVELSNRINVALENAKLKGFSDAQVFAPNYQMRVPGSLNQKENEIDRVVQVVFGKLEPQDYDFIVDSKLAFVDEEETITTKELSYFKLDVPQIIHPVEGCTFLHHALKNAHSLSEPEWYATVGVLARLDDDGKLTHEFSKKHDSYKFDETERKRLQALESSGPRKCSSIEKLWSGCTACQHYKKISSPVMIKSPDFIATAESGFCMMGKGGAPRPQYLDLLKHYHNESPVVNVTATDTMYKFDGTHFEQTYDASVKAYAQENFRFNGIQICNNQVASEFLGTVKRSFEHDANFFYDSIVGKINLENGILDLKTRVITPHSPEYGFRSTLPFKYDPTATAPKYMKLLSAVLKDPEVIEIFLEFCAYAITGASSVSAKFMMIVGPGGSGKSTLIKPLEALMNGLTTSLNMNNFLDGFMLSQLEHSYLNISEEEAKFTEDRAWEMLKNFTQGGMVTANVKFKPAFQFRNKCKFIFLANELPKGASVNEGFFRRVILIHTNQTFHDQDNTNLWLADEIIKEELPGILNLILMAWERLESRGMKFQTTKKLEANLDAYRTDLDSVAQWCDDNLQINGLFDALLTGVEYQARIADVAHPFAKQMNGEVLLVISEMRESYATWAKKEGYGVVGTKTFTQRVESWTRKKLENKYGKKWQTKCSQEQFPDDFISVTRRVNGKKMRVIRGLELLDDSPNA